MSKHDQDCPVAIVDPVEPLDERDPCQCKLIKKIRGQYEKKVKLEYGWCVVCENPIRTVIFRNEKWCSERCRKIYMKED
jgi:hypothetical protein